MNEPRQRRLLGRHDGGSTRGRASLPHSLLAASARRVRLAAAMFGVAMALGFITQSVAEVSEQFGGADAVTIRRLALLVGMVGALVVFMLSRLGRFEPPAMMKIGYAFFLLAMSVVSVMDCAAPWGPASFEHGIPIPAIGLVVFPIIAPSPPRVAMWLWLAGAATFPIAMVVVSLAAGRDIPGADVFVLALVPLVLFGVMGALIAKVVYELGGDLERAEQLGSYRLVAPLGQGGMGEVWRAEHAMLARKAAIKLIRGDTESQDPQAIAQFRREARAIASLGSPHTIEIYDFGITDDGERYDAMELLDGLDLDVLVQRFGPMPPERVIHFMIQACHSLGEAHDAGLVHRDIKPANLFAAKVGRDHDVLKLLDFGLAKGQVPAEADAPGPADDGSVQGTPSHMAPEQVKGEASLDGRADLYALGCVAWWLLTGRDVFVGTSSIQLMFAHVEVDAPPPSSAAPGPIPAALDALVLSCLAKRPADRPQHADVLGAQLEAIPLAQAWDQARAAAWWADVAADRAVSVPATTSELEVAATLAATTIRVGQRGPAGDGDDEG